MAQHQQLLRFLQLFTILCSVLFVETASDIQENKKAVLRSVTQCRGKRNLPMVFSDFQTKHDDRTNETLFSFTVNVKKTVSNNLAIGFSFLKCDASGNPDSCEYILKDHNITDICTYLQAKDELWTVFVDHLDKPLICPIKPDVYHLVNQPMSTDFLRFLPVGNALWKVQFVGYDQNKIISCAMLVMEIVPSYVKRTK